MQQLPPIFLLFANVTVAGGILVYFQRFGLSHENFALALLSLAGLYGLFNAVRQSQGLGQYQILQKINLVQLSKRVVIRYLVWLGLIYSAWLFFHLEPFYAGEAFRINRILFSQLLNIYLWVGLPYFAITLLVRHSSTEDYYDPAIRFVFILKHLLLSPTPNTLRRVFRKRYNVKVVLNLFMRLYFIPVMVVQVYANIYYSVELAGNRFQQYDFMVFMFWLAYFLFLMDVCNACVSYLFESRWLENRSRSIDLTAGGWLVCLMCYEPLNRLTDAMFVFSPMAATNTSADLVLNNVTFLYIVKTIEIIFLSAHVCCNLSLGPSVANITLKKLQTRGPYALIRHPGTTTKLSLWLMQAVFYRKFWTLKFIFGYCGWALIYYLRTVTEERHLKHFAEYREYMKKVKYRFFPGLF